MPPSIRNLTTSFDGPTTAPGANLSAQLERPPSGQGFNPLPQVTWGINDTTKKLCDANLNRITLLLRGVEASPTQPNAVIYLVGPGGGDPTPRLFPLGVGETLSLDITGDVWAWSPGTVLITVAVAEVIGPAQRS